MSWVSGRMLAWFVWGLGCDSKYCTRSFKSIYELKTSLFFFKIYAHRIIVLDQSDLSEWLELDRRQFQPEFWHCGLWPLFFFVFISCLEDNGSSSVAHTSFCCCHGLNNVVLSCVACLIICFESGFWKVQGVHNGKHFTVFRMAFDFIDVNFWN